MIEKLHIIQYRKLKNIDLTFSKSLNAISGANGTCKSSLLHMISNSFSAVSSKADFIKDRKCLSVLKSVNSEVNPKIESLTRGDQKYNDPAHGISGALYTAYYYGHEKLDFRRHNSDINDRYAIKPMYKRGAHDSLPCCPVIYLGISRLVPYGEYKNDDYIRKLKKNLPKRYWREIAFIYKEFTHYEIDGFSIQEMGDIKKRLEFSSETEGIDSNTVSAGEDNLLIILTALVSLKYYYESIESTKEIESLLLIDELDATLHPAYQIKLLKLFREFASQYKIQVIFTTHSMSILEDMLENRDNVLYLIDNQSSVLLMEEPDIDKIKMHLSNLTQKDIYRDKVIPIFTEDAESRFMINMLLDFYEDKYDEFKGCKRFFYLPDVNFGGENLSSMFKDSKLLRMTMKSICILDGDKEENLDNYIMTLPSKNAEKQSSGNLSPETLLFEYARILYDNDDSFWTDRPVIDRGYGKTFYLERIDGKQKAYNNEVEEGKTTKKRREFNKELFNEEKEFFELLFKHWLNNSSNNEEIDRFYSNLHKLFFKLARYNDISPDEWKIHDINL